MADSGSRSSLSVTPPNQVAKDVLENPIPLSPQWLLSKPGENKAVMAPGEIQVSTYGFANRPEVIKSPRHWEEHENQKKKDVFRPTFIDSESGRRDRWRDEERDTNLSIRRDRWREGDKELSDNKRDRWVDNSSAGRFGEARHPSSDRRSENKDINPDQRRESKWNTRWGPDGKEVDKWFDNSKHGDDSHDKGLSHVTNHGKDDKGVNYYRPWRSNSSQSRGKMESLHHQTQMPSKEGPLFPYGRGRGDSALPTFSVGRGRVGFLASSADNISAHSQPIGFVFEKGDIGNGDPSPFKYSRTKLLDVYRATDMRSMNKLLDGFVQVPSITQVEYSEPLALCAPSAEESYILKGIDKGEIVTSGALQISKDGSNDRSSMDILQSRRIRLGSKDDLPFPTGDTNDSADNFRAPYNNFSTGSPNQKQINSYLSSAKVDSFNGRTKYTNTSRADGSFNTVDEVHITTESDINESASVRSGTPWWSSSVCDHAPTRDGFHVTVDLHDRISDTSWPQAHHPNNEWKSEGDDPSYSHNEHKWQAGQDHISRRQSSLVPDKGQEPRKVLQPSPDNLLLFYKDPQGEVRGPFSGGDIVGWFESGYFGIDLQVRLANASNDVPFSSLGDVMPHLRTKARPPPGFTAARQNELPDVSGRVNATNFGNVLASTSGIDVVRNEQRYGSPSEAENKFLELLMSANMCSSPLERFALSEGPQGYFAHNSGSMPPLGMESADALNLLTKRMIVEQQRSLPNPYSYWPAIDAASVGPTPVIIHDSSMPQANLLPMMAELSRQPFHPQNADIMTMLQGLSVGSSSGINGVAGWQNLPAQGGSDPYKDKIEIHQGQSLPQPSLPQQRFHLQQSPTANLMAQMVDNSSSMLTFEKLLSSGLSQDPQIMNLLLQQHLLQLQSQAPIPVQQTLVEKILLLQQQQKQEEQQQLLREPQQLLAQVLAESLQPQRLREPSYAHLHSAGIPVTNGVLVQPQPPLSHQMFQVGSHVPVSSVQEDSIVNLPNVLPQVVHDADHTVSSDVSSLPLPHQIFRGHQRSCAAVPDGGDEMRMSDSSFLSAMHVYQPTPEVIEKCSHDPSLVRGIIPSEGYLPQTIQLAQSNFKTEDSASTTGCKMSATSIPSGSSLTKQSVAKSEDENLLPKQAHEAKALPGAVEPLHIEEQKSDDLHVVKEPLKTAQSHDAKKGLEKRSRKNKSSKVQPTSDLTKEIPRIATSHLLNESENRGTDTRAIKSEVLCIDAGGVLGERSMEKTNEALDSREVENSLSRSLSGGDGKTMELRSDAGPLESIPPHLAATNALQRAWKQGVNVRAKSLVEIQEEEQKKTQTEILSPTETALVNSISLSTQAGILDTSELNVARDILKDGFNDGMNNENPKSKKSQLHDLLAREVLVKSGGREIEVPEAVTVLPSLLVAGTLSDSINDGNFIEAKDTKKGRKKAAKAKGAGHKVAAPAYSTDVITGSSPAVKGKNSRQQSEKEFLPAPPVGPSFGDFIPWKGEATSPSPAPAWSTDSGKFPKPTYLRDILKEQEKKFASPQPHVQMPIPEKSQSGQATHAGSWPLSSSSPSKTVSPSQMSSNTSSQLKHKGDDDFFWGPLDQSKQGSKQVDSPQLGNSGSGRAKTTPVKGSPGASSGLLGSRKSVGGMNVESSSLSAAGQSSLKSKRDANMKFSEAMDFRDWCENESVRLTGDRDTSFLEFCLKQSRSEAEILLIQNLGSCDPNHKFIHKFLDYMEMLPADVLDLAFQSQNDPKATSAGPPWDMISDNASTVILDKDVAGPDGSAKGWKKKGKKGKKVSPMVLGFNVVSNRIMMGEIQSVQD